MGCGGGGITVASNTQLNRPVLCMKSKVNLSKFLLTSIERFLSPYVKFGRVHYSEGCLLENMVAIIPRLQGEEFVGECS